jgi:uncharacterized membrane protein YgcG
MADEPEGAGNNLSVPAIWAEGVAIIAPVTIVQFADPSSCQAVDALELEESPFLPESTPPCVYVSGAEGTYYWLQQRAENRWEAESRDNVDYPYGVDVDVIDWGDNLESVPWYLNSVVRVETVLFKNVSDAPMLGYTMHRLWDQGPEEMHGASGPAPEATMTTQTEARIYTDCARLTIQKVAELPAEGEEPPALPIEGPDWQADTAEWTGEGVYEPVFNKAVYEAGDGPSYYSAEINIGGAVVFGYNWFVSKANDGAGLYRLTFSLDDACPVGLNTFFDEWTVIAVPVEEEELTTIASEDGDSGAPGGGGSALNVDDQLTYLDMYILGKKGGGKSNPGGNGGGGGGDGGHNGGGGDDVGGGGKGHGGSAD